MHNLTAIVADKKPKVGTVLFIAIDGHSGSGKSTLAKVIAEKLNAEIIHTDDFASPNIPFKWNSILVENVIDPIRNGKKTLNYNRSKWWDNHFPEPVADQPITSIMILEGVGSIRPEFSPYVSLSIFVDTPKDVCLERGIARDMQTGKTKTEIEEFWRKWTEGEYSFFHVTMPKQSADIIIDGTRPFDSQIVF